jgi:ribosome-associated protein
VFVITDFFVICSGQSNRQVQSIAENIEEKLREQKVRKVGLESDRQGNWILLDYGAVVIHVFTQEQREYYQLERLWSDAPRTTWKETG